MQFYVGEALVGDGNEVAHIDLMIGSKDGPVGVAFANALSTQSKGHTNLLAVLEPNVAVKPSTVMITKVTIDGLVIEDDKNAKGGAIHLFADPDGGTEVDKRPFPYRRPKTVTVRPNSTMLPPTWVKIWEPKSARNRGLRRTCLACSTSAPPSTVMASSTCSLIWLIHSLGTGAHPRG